MTLVRVNVTSKHIAAGTRRSTTLCPVARAVADALGHAMPPDADITVSNLITVWHRGQWVAQWRLPRVVNRFIISFDAHKTVRPFAFDLAWEAA